MVHTFNHTKVLGSGDMELLLPNLFSMRCYNYKNLALRIILNSGCSDSIKSSISKFQITNVFCLYIKKSIVYTKELTSKDVKQKAIPSITQDTFNTGVNVRSQLRYFQK